ncbi:MAG: hypothetical protein R3B69_00440 [Candidatus Paceibacterota bacterium]
MYNNNEHPSYIHTAGKVTVVTTLLGTAVFALVFLLNIGQKEFQTAEAQSQATTSVLVLNTPPQWTLNAYEVTESSTSTPTNSGDDVQWSAIATDSNAEPYWLLVCSNNATPTPGTSTSTPTCGTGATQWAVSATTTSGALAVAATTTTEVAPFAEKQDWYAWICDAIDLNARCNNTPTNGLSATNSSPFHVNSRPVFTAFYDDSPAVPGSVVTFTSTSSDSDTVGGADTLQLIVCNEADYNSATNACGAGGTLATSTFVVSDATATYTIVIPTQDQDYTAYGYVVDEHGHEASGGSQGTDATLTVDNIAPTVAAASIVINGGSDMVLTTESGETTGFTLDFVATDNNSCENAATTDEIVDYTVSLYRNGSGVSSTTCDAEGSGAYDPNNCYQSEVGAAVWNLSCTASSTSCTGPTDTTQLFECTFPLWYVADPTDGGATNTVHFALDWSAEVNAVDDDNATGTDSEASTGQELNSLLAFALNTLQIPYGELEPGNDTGTLSATTSIAATGNVGLDEELTGESMCTTYSGVTPCPTSATSTIPETEQEFATSELAYGLGTALSSSTQQELEINVSKTTSTSTPATGLTYWGIAVPATISLAGLYTGENTFYAVVSEPGDW